MQSFVQTAQGEYERVLDGLNLENVVSYCLENDFRSRSKQEFIRVVSGLQCCLALKRGLFERKKNGYLEKNRKRNGESNVWCQTGRQEKYRTCDGYVRIESNHR